jgi:hypothetical protein
MISNEPANSGQKFWRIVGMLVIALGLMIAIYFRDFYTISVHNTHDDNGASDNGLLQTRQNRILGGVELSILGAVIRFYRKESR